MAISRSAHVENLPMLVWGLRLATQGCTRKVVVDSAARRSSLGRFGWTRNMADSGNTAAGAQEAGQPVVKTEKQLKKEAQKNAKLAKYQEKLAKQKAQTAGEVKNPPSHNPPPPPPPPSPSVPLNCRQSQRRSQLARRQCPPSPMTSPPLPERRRVSVATGNNSRSFLQCPPCRCGHSSALSL